MINLEQLKEWFPQTESWFDRPAKESVIEKLQDCKEIYKDDTKDYQGTELIIFKRDEDYAVYIGGYGSCSGCDSWLDINSYEKLLEQLPRIEVDFGTKSQCLAEINSALTGCGEWDNDSLRMYKDAISFLEKYS